MIRLSRLADYGVVLLTHLASRPDARRSAQQLADECNLPMPTVSKVLKKFTQGGLLISHRGTRGGYALAAAPEDITVHQIIAALDGPIALTDCSGDESPCDISSLCPTRPNWQMINDAITGALDRVTLADMQASILGMFGPPPRAPGDSPAARRLEN